VATDKSGNFIMDELKEAGHRVNAKTIIKDDVAMIQAMIAEGCRNPEVDVIITNGGTGIANRDVTIEAIKGILEKEMPGFGEIFRMISYKEDIGSAAILSRAIAGVSQNTAIFAVPGSSGAVKLAMRKLIIPELSHIINELKKDANKQ
jgi:molybdenum cofactor biosynthesis protein B